MAHIDLDFGEALLALKAGDKVTRAGWNGVGMWIQIKYPEVPATMTLPYIFMRTVDGNFVPWLASQTDLLAEDWIIPRD